MSIKKLYINLKHTKNPVLFRLRQWALSFTLIENLAFHAKMPDEKYIRMKYKERFGVYPDLDHPRNFNEKNNWRKLHDRKAIYTSMVDKYKVKTIIAERVGAEHTFQLLGVWDKPEQIDWDSLPDQFVLKCNHSGGLLVCRDKVLFDRKSAVKSLKKMQRINYFIRSREWPYKNVQKKIVAEEYMGENLIDYKNYCFGGKLLYTFVWKNHSRKDGLKPVAHFCGAYDREWIKSGIEIDYPVDDAVIKKPICYEEMVEVAERMSKDIPFVRVDCYIINGHVYVGEMTFFPWGGFQNFKDEKWNDFLGSKVVLNE